MKKISAGEMDELLTRGVGEFIDPNGVFRRKLETNPEKIVIKFGVDPTKPDIHIGHAVVLRKLRTFQELGCKVVFLIGDLTALIGDPTGKNKVRPEVSQVEIEANMKTYLDQVGKILNLDKSVFSWIRNSDWFISMNDMETADNVVITIGMDGKEVSLPPLPKNHTLVKAFAWSESRMQKQKIVHYSFLNVLAILKRITVNRLLERDMFEKRLEEGRELYMHELMYPILQGIDSSVIAKVYDSCDLEVGGTDQTFNMLLGRDVMKMNEQEQQSVLAFELLEGLDGKEKMSKSLDNYIAITDTPEDMYGKVMSIPDTLITKYFKLATYSPTEDIEHIEKELAGGNVNPRDYKMRLAREIIAIYHGEEAATKAEQSFVDTFAEGKIPEDVSEIHAEENEMLVDVLLRAETVSSKTDFRRLAEAGAITNLDTGESVGSVDAKAIPGTYRIGKKRFLKITS